MMPSMLKKLILTQHEGSSGIQVTSPLKELGYLSLSNVVQFCKSSQKYISVENENLVNVKKIHKLKKTISLSFQETFNSGF